MQVHYRYKYNTTATTLHYTTLHFTNYITLHYSCSYHYIALHNATLQLQLHYFTLQYTTTTTTTTALHHTTSSSCGEVTTATIAATPENTTPTTFRSTTGFALPPRKITMEVSEAPATKHLLNTMHNTERVLKRYENAECHRMPPLPGETNLHDVWNLQKKPLLRTCQRHGHSDLIAKGCWRCQGVFYEA